MVDNSVIRSVADPDPYQLELLVRIRNTSNSLPLNLHSLIFASDSEMIGTALIRVAIKFQLDPEYKHKCVICKIPAESVSC